MKLGPSYFSPLVGKDLFVRELNPLTAYRWPAPGTLATLAEAIVSLAAVLH